MKNTFLTEQAFEEQKKFRRTLSHSQRKEDNWQKVIKKVLYDLYPQYPKEEDEQNMADIWLGTGINFYRGLILLQDHLQNLKIKIPETFCIIQGSYILYNDEEGGIAISSGSLREFYEMLQAKYHPLPGDMDAPACVLRRIDEDDSDAIKSTIWTWQEFQENYRHSVLDGFNMTLLQAYIPQKQCISSYRIVVPQKLGKVPFGILRRSNQAPMNKASYLLSYLPFSFEHFFIGENGIRPFLFELKKLHAFLSKTLLYNVEYMVADFIKGKDGITYLISLRFLQLTSASYLMAINAKCDNKFKPGSQIKKDVILPSKCKLCMLKFNKAELTNRLPLKMLLVLKEHLSRRGLFMFSHLDHIPYQSHNHGVYICNLCFLFITHEQNLILAEKMMAFASNIPFQLMPNSTVDCFGKGTTISRPPLLQDKLLQWRTLLYCCNLRDNDSSILKTNTPYQIKFKTFYDKDTTFEFSQSTIGAMRKSRTGTYSASPSPRYSPKSTFSKVTYSYASLIRINQIRVNYFYTIDYDIGDFLNNFKVIFSLYQSDKLIAQGCCFPLKGFDLHKEKIQAEIHNVNAYLFTDNMKKIALEVKVGICNDDIADTTTFNISKMSDYNIYIPEDYYYNSYYFPVEWMKLFKQEYSEEQHQDENINTYRSHLTKREFDPQIFIKEARQQKSQLEENEFDKEVINFISLSNSSTPTARGHAKPRHHSLMFDNRSPPGIVTTKFVFNKKEENQVDNFSNEIVENKASRQNKFQITQSSTTKGKENTQRRARPFSALVTKQNPIHVEESKFKRHKLTRGNNMQKLELLNIYGDVVSALKKHEKPTRSIMTSRSRKKADYSGDKEQVRSFQEKHKQLMRQKSAILKEIESGKMYTLVKPYLI